MLLAKIWCGIKDGSLSMLFRSVLDAIKQTQKPKQVN